MKSFKQYISEASRGKKGWVHSKTGKTFLWSGMEPYHVQYVVKNLSKFGLKEKDVLDVLTARFDKYDAPEPKEDAVEEFEKLRNGRTDVDRTVELLAIKKGWCRVVLGDWCEIAGYDFRQMHQAAKQLDKKENWISGLLGLEIYELDEGNGPVKKGYKARYKKVATIDSHYDVQQWIDGRSADPSNIGKGRTEIGSTMAMFRGEAVEGDCQVYTPKQIKDLEVFADRLLNKFGIDIEFTKHFRDRMNDTRNRPCIKISELQQLFKKMNRAGGKRIKGHGEGQAVVLDIQRDLNLPVVIDMKNNGDFEVRAKTIMRKKNFRTSNKKILY